MFLDFIALKIIPKVWVEVVGIVRWLIGKPIRHNTNGQLELYSSPGRAVPTRINNTTPLPPVDNTPQGFCADPGLDVPFPSG